ncbi:MAG: polysaccharide export protein [Moorea sp. SIO2B7]|nr:polysaccharide export protein [Moorena sp. SIO2B7]
MFIDASVAQTPSSVSPKEQTPQSTKELLLQPPPPTFDPANPIPPAGYSPPPFKDKPSNQFNIYRLDVGDGITINVQRFPEFSVSGVIDAEGNILIPILGRMSLVGLTLEEVETKISFELGRRFLKSEPEVISALVAPRPVDITLVGEIVRPGFYTLAPNTPITSLILSAGGSTSDADLRSIIVRRTLVDGTLIEETVNLYGSLIEGRKPPDIRLQGGDTIIVSRLQVGTDKDYDRVLISRTTLPQQTITVRVLVPVEPSGQALRNLTLANGSTFLDLVATLPSVDNLRIKTNEVALMRFDEERGGIVTQTLNPKQAIRGNIAQNIPLKDQDVIVVGRTLLGKVFSAFNVITQPIRDIFGFTSFFRGLGDNF